MPISLYTASFDFVTRQNHLISGRGLLPGAPDGPLNARFRFNDNDGQPVFQDTWGANFLLGHVHTIAQAGDVMKLQAATITWQQEIPYLFGGFGMLLDVQASKPVRNTIAEIEITVTKAGVFDGDGNLPAGTEFSSLFHPVFIT